MLRNRFLAVTAVVGLLGGLALLARPGSAGPIDPIFLNLIDGSHQVGPAGTGLTDIFLTQGNATSPQVPGFRFAVSDLELMSGPGGTVQIGNPSPGPATLTLSDPNNPDDMATLLFSKSTNRYDGLKNPSLTARVFLASNTFPELDFSAFQSSRGGGVFALSTTGIEIDSLTNTATIAPGATATFSLTAVPEPASAVLMLCAGASTLAAVGLGRLRRRRAP